MGLSELGRGHQMRGKKECQNGMVKCVCRSGNPEIPVREIT